MKNKHIHILCFISIICLILLGQNEINYPYNLIPLRIVSFIIGGFAGSLISIEKYGVKE